MADAPEKGAARLPAERAFVVQVAEGSPPDGALCGRAEHLTSGSAVHFDSLAGLGEFIARALRSAAAPAPRRPQGGSR